ncbi:MAG: Xaa-Pro aminopeptidase [Gammaproteobacteria bacterium AqS3]|nr:Xaa-Pro aminopeptidase [Gammaproteobacteria bacterium AqS3]
MQPPPPLPPAEYAARRSGLLERLSPGSVAVLGGARQVLRNGDAHYRFRQNSDFWYLTGFPEPEALLVLRPGADDGIESALFCRGRDAHSELWDGARAGPERAAELYGLDAAYDVSQIDDLLTGWLDGADTLYSPSHRDPVLRRLIARTVGRVREQGGQRPKRRADILPLIHGARLCKSDGEIERLRYSAQVAAAAHRRAMRSVQPGQWEYQLEAEYLHEFMRHGAREAAYCGIVAGGANACVLHYTDNDRQLRAGELVLVDAGCEYQGYASDITRTFPVDGAFTAPQRDLYQVVLAANEALIDGIHQGSTKQELEAGAVRLLTRGLVDLGLLSGDVDALIEDGAHRTYYMHGVSHWLGLDVHDAGPYTEDRGRRSRTLHPGTVFTVEPGLYIAPDSADAAEHWRGIGIRIEDDVLIRPDGAVEVLSGDVPKSVEGITELMRQANPS